MALVSNKKALYDFQVLETYEAGIELFGYEVKSLRNGHGSLKGAHVVVRGGEAYLVGATIPAVQPKNAPASFDPERPRRLLLTKKELDKLRGVDATKGLTMVPISLYNKKRYIKLEFASVRGKKMADKREAIKERDTKRDIERIMKQQNR